MWVSEKRAKRRENDASLGTAFGDANHPAVRIAFQAFDGVSHRRDAIQDLKNKCPQERPGVVRGPTTPLPDFVRPAFILDKTQARRGMERNNRGSSLSRSSNSS